MTPPSPTALEDALAARDEKRVADELARLADASLEPITVRAALALAKKQGPAGAARAVERIATHLAHAASANEALVHLLHALASFDDPPETIPDACLERAVRLCALGGAPAESLAAHPEDLVHLTEPVPSTAGDLDALRVARRRSTLAIAGAELTGLPTREAARLLSAAADALLDAALALARESVARRNPLARELPCAVLALGKLGGVELNYSSDVDLVIVRGDDAPADVAEAIARAFIRSLEDASAGGRLYRTDLRLRPEGSTGALAPRVKGALEYYRKSAATWERQAFIKARVCAGTRELGERFLAELAAFTWEAPLDAKGIDEIVKLRARIEAKAGGVLEGDAARNVKEGPGGIRDVEYCVQFLQLLWGGKNPSLRVTGTLLAVDRLEAASLIKADEATALRESYGFLRHVEHALQLARDRELKQVPRDPEPRARLARALGLSLGEFDRRLAEERTKARRTLDALLRKPFAQGKRTSERLAAVAPSGSSPGDDGPAATTDEQVLERARRTRDLVLAPTARGPEALEVVRALGFREPQLALRDLDLLAEERSRYLAPSGRARTLLAGLAPRLLAALGRAPDPDHALRNLERATATLGAKATFYELLLENEDALELFVALAAASDFLVEALARRPGVFDEVVDRLLTGEKLSRDAIRAEADAALARESAEEALRDVRAVHLLLIGIRDVSGRANVQNTGRDLAVLAEAMLEALLARARGTIEARHGGAPADSSGPVRFAALALGKLGAFELSYSSDLDLQFVHSGAGAAPDGTTADVFFEEVAREALRLGQGAASDEGPLYPIDLRLRPAGGRGQLSVRLEAAKRYYAGEGPGEHAADWERLALQKLRAAAGDRPFADEATAAISDVVYARTYGPELRKVVGDMRAKQVEAADPDDLKRGLGGLADVEFLASTLALENGIREPNTARLLTLLRDAHRIGPGEHLELMTAYQFLRRVELRLRVASNKAESRVPREADERRGLALRLGYVDAGTPAQAQFDSELRYHRRRARTIFEAVLAR